jgi:hypothetical protein
VLGITLEKRNDWSCSNRNTELVRGSLVTELVRGSLVTELVWGSLVTELVWGSLVAIINKIVEFVQNLILFTLKSIEKD